MPPTNNKPGHPPIGCWQRCLKTEYERLQPLLRLTTLTFGDVLYDSGDTIKARLFPCDSIISLLSAVAERSTLEVGIVGNEGMAGLPVFMGVNVSRTRALVQVEGSAMRMTSGPCVKKPIS